MFWFLFKRILGIIPVALGVVILTSLMIHAVPGDPIEHMLGELASAEQKTELRAQLGLDRPVLTQIKQYVLGVSQGDLGRSILSQRPVVSLISERIVATFELAVVSMLVAIFIAIPLGILSALYAGRSIDALAMTIALLGVAMPNFWLGPMLVLFFSLQLDLLPVSGRGDLATYILPAITLGTALAAVLSRMTRNSVLDCLNEDYVRTARAKGCRESIVICKHVLRNASLPVVTIAGLQFGVLLTGAIITEKIFDWPGLGSLLLDGLFSRDYPVVQGCVLLFASSYVLVNLVTDLLYGVFDPRIRVSS